MENFTLIDFHRTRDFSKKINATFEFIKQNLKPLAKSVLFIAGPPILIASLLIGSFYESFMKTTLATATGGGDPSAFEAYMSVSFWLQIVLMMMFFFIGFVAIVATTNNYIILYEEKKTNKIEVDEVWARVRSTFPMYLGTMILYFVVLTIGVIALAVPIAYASQISVAITVFGFIALFLAVFYVMYGTAFIFFIRGYEKISFIDSILRSLYLVKGKWWSTFGLILILSMIGGCLSYVFFIPWYAMTLVSAFHDLSGGVAAEPSTTKQIVSLTLLTLYYLTALLMYVIPNIGIVFQYFNLVERKEARGLMNQIDTLGVIDQSPAPANEDF